MIHLLGNVLDKLLFFKLFKIKFYCFMSKCSPTKNLELVQTFPFSRSEGKGYKMKGDVDEAVCRIKTIAGVGAYLEVTKG